MVGGENVCFEVGAEVGGGLALLVVGSVGEIEVTSSNVVTGGAEEGAEVGDELCTLRTDARTVT